MSLFHDIKYLQLLSPLLTKFIRKDDFTWNFRCPICLDSQKSPNKRRGYVYKQNNDLFYKCHNCGASLSFGNFIKKVNPGLYDEYVLERYSHGESSNKAHTNPDFKNLKPKPRVTKSIIDLPKISFLKKDHPAYQYIQKRKLPDMAMDLLYYTDNFEDFAVKLTAGDYKRKLDTKGSDPRIVIPFLDQGGRLIALQGRAVIASALRYTTVKLKEDVPKVFGLDRWNPRSLTYITEGPFDSLFLPNCLAMAGSIIDLSSLNLEKESTVFVYDNERRNKEIVELMNKQISNGYGIVIWNPTNNKKDINDMILSGRTKEDILLEIQQNTRFGITANLLLNEWKRC